MNTRKVLILDDEANGRSRTDRSREYQKLTEDKTFEVIFADNMEHARELLERPMDIDIVLLDVVLKYWGEDETATRKYFRELFQLADSKELPVGLVSRAWSNDALEIVRSFLEMHREVYMPLLFDFNNDFNNDKIGGVRSHIITYIRRKNRQYSLKLEPDDDLRLLHISDLHFGTAEAKKSLTGRWKQADLFQQIKTHWKEGRNGERPAGPDLVAVTGDIGDRGYPDDYDEARKWFEAFAEEFKWSFPSTRFLIVPGNHDFSVPLYKSTRLNLKKETKTSKEKTTSKLILSRADIAPNDKLAKYAMLPFSEFAVDVCGDRHLHANYPLKWWVEYGYSEYGVVFSGFNTSRSPASSKDVWPSREVDEDDLEAIMRKFREYKDKNKNSKKAYPIHILLSHHSLVKAESTEEEINDVKNFSKKLLGKPESPDLLLTGHQHEHAGNILRGRYFSVTAATPTKSPNQDPNDVKPCGVNLLTLKRKNSKVIGIEAKTTYIINGEWQNPRDLSPNCEWKRKN